MSKNFIYPATVINPSNKHVQKIVRKLENNDGYCPSVEGASTLRATIHMCPCLNYRETGNCKCGLYIPEEEAKQIIEKNKPKSMINKEVIIESSQALSEMKLDALVGASGIVVEELIESSRKNKGCFIRFIGFEYEGENEWFIPLTSIKLK